MQRSSTTSPVTVHDSAEQLIRSSDLVVFATTAGQPHIHDAHWFEHNPLVLHVSLRDLAPEIVLASANIVDDIEHCLKADTSPHLAEQLTGSRDFLDGTLDDVMAGRVTPPTDRPLLFSPFGLGVLDLAVAKYVYDETARSRRAADYRSILPRAKSLPVASAPATDAAYCSMSGERRLASNTAARAAAVWSCSSGRAQK